MKKFLYPLLFSMTTLSANVFACTPATGYDYKALVVATGLNQPKLVQKLTGTYCYDLDKFDFSRINSSHPAFFSSSPVFMNYYLKAGRNLADFKEIASGLDVLSFVLISPYAAYYKSSPEEKQEIINLISKYEPTATVEWFDNPFQTIDNYGEKYKNPSVWMNHELIIEQLLPLYSNILDMPTDKNGNTALDYAILTNEASAFEALSKSSFLNFYKFNKDGFTPFHLAFAKKYTTEEPDRAKISQERINNILMNNFKPEKVDFLNIQDVSFNAFMEAMKENNMDLYNKLTGKQKAFGLYPNSNESIKSVVENNKKFYLDTMDYIKTYL